MKWDYFQRGKLNIYLLEHLTRHGTNQEIMLTTFMGEVTTFGKILPRFFFENSLQDSTVNEKILFCMRHYIGFTDLITEITNADYHCSKDRNRVLSFRDTDLLFFEDNLVFNTKKIQNYIKHNADLEGVYFTLKGQNVGAISNAMSQIQNFCTQLNRIIPTYRLHSPTGNGLRKGVPRENRLTKEWYKNGLCNVNQEFKPGCYPFTM